MKSSRAGGALTVVYFVCCYVLVGMLVGYCWWLAAALAVLGLLIMPMPTGWRPLTLSRRRTAPATPAAASDGRAAMVAAMRLTCEAGIPYLDYEAGQVWPVDRQREWLARQDRRVELQWMLAAVDEFLRSPYLSPGAQYNLAVRQLGLRRELNYLDGKPDPGETRRELCCEAADHAEAAVCPALVRPYTSWETPSPAPSRTRTAPGPCTPSTALRKDRHD